MLLWKRYVNNKMAAMLFLHLQQYSHRLNLLYVYFITNVEFACFRYVFFAFLRSPVALVRLEKAKSWNDLSAYFFEIFLNTGGPPYPRVIRSKT